MNNTRFHALGGPAWKRGRASGCRDTCRPKACTPYLAHLRTSATLAACVAHARTHACFSISTRALLFEARRTVSCGLSDRNLTKMLALHHEPTVGRGCQLWLSSWICPCVHTYGRVRIDGERYRELVCTVCRSTLHSRIDADLRAIWIGTSSSQAKILVMPQYFG